MTLQKSNIWTAVVFFVNIGIMGEACAQNVVSPLKPINEQRVEQIRQMLTDQPAGYGDPSSKRAVWDQLLHSGKYDKFLNMMEHFNFPSFSKQDYFSLSDGSATSSAQGLTMMRNRAKGLSQATWAECLRNDGKFTPIVEAGLRDILHQRSWVSPRNDFNFKNYKGEEYSVELTSALYAHTIAQTLYMMGDKLDPALRSEAIEALRKRVFDPVLRKIKTQNKDRENAFLQMTNNYNHVCLSGVVGAALTVLKDKHERAVFAYIGEYYSKNGLSGFNDDGYCTEGITYYTYGFGHYVLLGESLRQATQGQLDLFQPPKVKKIARYGASLEIINGIYPAISDSPASGHADSSMMYYLSRNLQLGLTDYDNYSPKGKTEDNRMDVITAFSNTVPTVSQAQRESKHAPNLRSYFDQSAVLVLRPLPAAKAPIGVAIKGGNNQEHHNHNDVGSYTIVQGKDVLMGDPGSIPYTADIFNPAYRYTYKTVGSYGHPVPLVNGEQQQPGVAARASVQQASFSDKEDIFEIDFAAAYKVSGLKKLTRTLTYARGTDAAVAVKDRFLTEQPIAFETALITRAHWKELPEGQILLEGKTGSMLVTIECPGNSVTLRTEEISEGGKPYTRIGIALSKPARSGEITLHYQSVK